MLCSPFEAPYNDEAIPAFFGCGLSEINFRLPVQLTRIPKQPQQRTVGFGEVADAPETQHKETLVGSVERVTFRNADSGFGVLKVKARGRNLVPIVGHAASIFAGEFIHPLAL
jgi:hypothetical protein